MNNNTEPALLDRAIRFAPLIFLGLAIVSGGICLGFFGPFTGDSSRYLLLGQNLARSHGFSAATAPPYYPETFRPPLYPAFLATMMRLGLGVYGIIAVQLLSYYLAVILIVRTASTITGNRLSALLLGLILMGYPPLVHWVVSITSEFLCSVLYCILCWSAYSFFRRPSWANTSVLSLTSAALFLTRPEYIVLFPLLVGISLYRFHRNSTWCYTGALAILMVLPTSGWMMRNVAVTPGPPRPLGLGAGMTLWIRTIELQEPDVGRRTAWLAHPDFQTLHSKDDPSALRVADDNLRREAIEVIRVRWPSYLEGSLIKLFVREWVEVFAPGLPIGLLWTTAGISFSLLALSYLGMALMRAKWSEYWPLVLITFGVAATHAFGGTEARYTAPLRSCLYMFSCFSLASLLQWCCAPRAVRPAGQAGVKPSLDLPGNSASSVAPTPVWGAADPTHV